MGSVKIKIDGKEFQVEEGKTILDACKENDIYIPTLCFQEALKPFGGCRMCVVDSGPGALKPACSTQVAEGMEVKTNTPQISETRLTVLQLLFGERNHYCMYCESSGDCELQNLGYKFGLDHFEFPPYEEKFPVDTSHPYILLDHNRCVLCRRCVRACAELAGHYVLDLKGRGFQALLNPDLGAPFQESTCTSCGLCVQVCPTGALVDKRAAYLGRKEQAEIVKTNCDRCPVGCGIEVSRRANFILKVYGDWDSPINRGVLCKNGRYLPLYEDRPRLTVPKLKEGGTWTQISAEMAFNLIKDKKSTAVTILEGSLPLELLQAFKEAFGERVCALNEVHPPIPSTATLKDLEDADTYLVVGVDLNERYGVVGSMIKRRVVPQDARLIAVESGEGLTSITDFAYEFKDIDTALGEARKGNKVVVVYSSLPEGIGERLCAESGFKFLFLPCEANTMALLELEIEHKTPQGKVKIYAGENLSITGSPGEFIVAFTPFETPEIKARADLIIPITWYLEDEGTFINLQGEKVFRQRVITPAEGILTVEEISSRLQKI